MDIETASAGKTLNFYAYSDGGGFDGFIANFLKPQLSELYDITVVHHKLTDTVDAVLQVEYESKYYSANNGSIDLIWINLENFSRLKNAGYLFGPWATKVPNAANFDFSDYSIAYDGGIPIAGYEFPYNGAQVAFFYNSAQVTTTTDIANLKTILGIKTWLEANPGRFTYAAPAANADASNYDFTGSAFIRHVFYEIGGPYTDFIGSTTVDTALYNKRAPKVFQYLRSLEPFLYTSSGLLGLSNNYPSNNTYVDSLFGNGDIWLTLNYDPLHAVTEIAAGTWPISSQGYVLSGGTLANTNYITIPKNAKHKLAAVVSTSE
jgi:putative spermidine/putrescine transport system substrate-binding protein